MLLRRIKLKNFRQYYDVVSIEFACDPEKNVTIIHAENGVGKTALLNAIKWCFYGSFTKNFRNPDKLVNFEAEKEGKTSCSVEIEFNNDGDEFLIIRRFDSLGRLSKAVQAGEVNVYKMVDGTWSGALPEPEMVVNGMLPEEMADYFFFQGEGSNAVETGNRGINLARSIRNILGFKVAESVQDIINKKRNSINKRIAALDTSGQAQKVAEDVERLNGKVVELEKDIARLNDLIPSLEFDLEMVVSELSKISHAELSSLSKEEKELEALKSKLASQVRNIQPKKYDLIRRFGWAVFGREFADESLEFIDESTLKGRLPEPYNKTFINDIIAASKCICGSDLHPGSSAYINVARLLEKAANPALQSRLGAIRSQIQEIKTLNELSQGAIKDVLNNASLVEDQLQSVTNKLELVKKKIKDIPVDMIAQLQSKKEKIQGDLNRQNQMLGGYISQHEAAQKNYESRRNELKRLTPNSEVLGELEIYIQYVNELAETLQQHLSKTERLVREHIASKVNSMMRSFSRHSYQIRISEKDFSIVLVNNDGTQVGQGDGLNLLLNLSITAALIEFVRERQSVRDPLLASATAAPLVIDAPFGVLDDSYRNVVVSNLPKHAEQVMFFVSSSQWRDEMDLVIRDRIGSEYCLVLEERAEQGDRKVDIFNIRGKEVIASRYGCERDRVLAKEII